MHQESGGITILVVVDEQIEYLMGKQLLSGSCLTLFSIEYDIGIIVLVIFHSITL